MKTNIIRNRRGAVLIIFAILLIVLIGFVALAMDVGRWYTVRAELSKSVDAASLAGAKNISNPFLGEGGNLRLAEEIGRENFSPGYLMTTESPVFEARALENHVIEVKGSVNSPGNLAGLFGVNQVPTASSGSARQNKVEIMLILDRSGSMSGKKMTDLKTAARNFIDYFKDTEDRDKMGLISFSTTARFDSNLGNNYVSTMKSLINGMSADGATNAEDALIRSIGPGGFSDQSGVPGDQRVQQFVIFFSDGMPTALRDTFKYNGTDYDGVVYGSGTSGRNNCRTSDYAYMSVSRLQRPTSNTTGDFYPGVNPDTTGDGKSASATSCQNCTTDWWGRETCVKYLNTKWYLFEPTRLGPVDGYGKEACSIPKLRLVTYFCNAARQLALDNAQTIKDRFIKIYVIGLGTSNDIDENYLRCISSDNCGTGSNKFTYITPNSSELQAIFNTIAKEIKLRLVE